MTFVSVTFPSSDKMTVCYRSVLSSKYTKLLLTLILVYWCYIIYKSLKIKTFTEMSSRYRQGTKENTDENDQVPVISDITQNSDSQKNDNEKGVASSIDVMITFTKANHNYNLQEKFKTTVRSLFHFATVPIRLHILGDQDSEKLATRILSDVTDKSKYTVVHLDVDSLAKQAHTIVSEMQKYFSHSPSAYYSDALFFVSIIMHRVLPDLHKVIMLDADLKFNSDIKDLYKLFDSFKPDNIMGIGNDMQPVYRHNFHMYRNRHKGTRVGGPPPDGLTGFNSGVLLLNLDRMRDSEVYNSLISAEKIKELTEKYMFKGHLGDQDFFSLIELDHEELFYVLPCTWNRQLCQWWKDHGYAEVFDQYFACEGHVNIYHGNCNTNIPQLPWEQ